MDGETVNAKITKTFLGVEDHGIPTAVVHVNMGGTCCGFGTHDLRFRGYGIQYLVRLLEAVGAESWEKLPGMYCRVKRSGCGLSAIGHIVENKWFEPEAKE